MRPHRPAGLVRGLLLSSGIVILALPLGAQTPKVFFACYVPSTGTVYRIKETGLPSACSMKNKTPDVEFSWTDGLDALRTTTLAGGDVAGVFGNLTVGRLNGRPLGPVVPTTGTALTWDGSFWNPQMVLAPGSVASGDLGGTFPGPTVAKIQGNAVAAGVPSDGQILSWDGASTSWKAKTPPSGVTAHSQLTGLAVGDDHPQYLLTNGVRTTTGVALSGSIGSGVAPVSGAGVRLMWSPGRAAFRAGQVTATQWDEPGIGLASFAAGFNSTASGPYSFAMGYNALATGSVATAMGDNAQARGNFSVALGQDITASGPTAVGMGGNILASGQSSIALGNDVRSTSFASVAMGVGGTLASGIATIAAGNGAKATADYSAAVGNNVTASGHSSTALGTVTTASGQFSTAMGIRSSTNGKQGAFAYGDASTTGNGDAVVTANADNEFVVRAAGGFRFRTSADLSTGCDLPAGSGVFDCTSSRRLKTGFESIDSEHLLSTLRGLPVTRWSYIAEGTGVRHLGPFAEEFHAAFGLGTNETSIGVLDIAGVGLAAAKALEERTRTLVAENAELRRENAAILERLSRLEAAMQRRP